MTIALIIIGAVLDVAGIAFVGAADFLPGARRKAVHIAALYGRARNWLLRVMLRRPPKSVTAKVSVSDRVHAKVRAELETATAAADVEGKLDYLLRESKRTQARLNALERLSEDQTEEVKQELERLSAELVEFVDRALTTSFAEYATARRVGLVCLGLAALSWTLAAVLSVR